MTASAPRLEDLVALNQEMASLVRAGIPLELGLRQHAAAWPSRFAVLADRIALRLSQGDSLVDALRQEGSAISPAYAGVVEAGLASGRLPEALEQLAELGLTVQEVRQRVRVSAAYPLIVCCLAYVLFVGFIEVGVPIWSQTRDALFLPPRVFFQLLTALHDTVRVWGPLIPVALVIGVIAQRLRAGDDTWRQIGFCQWIPGVSALYRDLLRAQFSRLLAVMVEHEVPSGRAVSLAAESTGDPSLRESAAVIAEQLERGATWGEAVSAATGLPRFLQWMMAVGAHHGALSAVMLQTSDAYQRKAERRLAWIRSVLPVVLVAVIAGGVVFLYCLCLMLPLQQFWFDLLDPNPR